MNQLPGRIRTIQTSGGLSLVEITVEDLTFTSVILRGPGGEPDLWEGQSIVVGFKETETSIGKDFRGGLSIRNRIPGVIRRLEKGQLLTRIHLDYRGHTVCSVITTRSAENLELKEGETVWALIKTNEILLLRHGE